MAALIAAEQRYAAQQAAKQLAPKLPEQPRNQTPSGAQSSQSTASGPLESVTRDSLNRTPGSPRDTLLKSARVRRRAAITQADIARIIRAAKQAGAIKVELRLNDSASVIVRLQPDNSVAPDEEIIL